MISNFVCISCLHLFRNMECFEYPAATDAKNAVPIWKKMPAVVLRGAECDAAPRYRVLFMMDKPRTISKLRFRNNGAGLVSVKGATEEQAIQLLKSKESVQTSTAIGSKWTNVLPETFLLHPPLYVAKTQGLFDKTYEWTVQKEHRNTKWAVLCLELIANIDLCVLPNSCGVGFLWFQVE